MTMTCNRSWPCHRQQGPYQAGWRRLGKRISMISLARRRGTGHHKVGLASGCSVTSPAVRVFHDRYVPLPVNETVWGLPPPSSSTNRRAKRLPVTAGVKVTLMEQVAPPPRLLLQELPWVGHDRMPESHSTL